MFVGYALRVHVPVISFFFLNIFTVADYMYGKGKPSEFRTQHVRGRKSSHSFEIIITPPPTEFFPPSARCDYFYQSVTQSVTSFLTGCRREYGTAAHTTYRYIVYPACIRLDGEGVQFSETR